MRLERGAGSACRLPVASGPSGGMLRLAPGVCARRVAPVRAVPCALPASSPGAPRGKAPQMAWVSTQTPVTSRRQKNPATWVPTREPEPLCPSSVVGKGARFRVQDPDSAGLGSARAWARSVPPVCVTHRGMLRSRNGPSPAGSGRQIWDCDLFPLPSGAVLALPPAALLLRKNKRFLLSGSGQKPPTASSN